MNDTETPRAQWLRGVLDMCLLAVIAEKPTYGYEMTVRLAESGLSVASGSIYPALARLRSRELVEVSRRPGDGGPERTYYHLSTLGAATLRSWGAEWQVFAGGVDRLLPDPSATDNNGGDHGK